MLRLLKSLSRVFAAIAAKEEKEATVEEREVPRAMTTMMIVEIPVVRPVLIRLSSTTPRNSRGLSMKTSPTDVDATSPPSIRTRSKPRFSLPSAPPTLIRGLAAPLPLARKSRRIPTRGFGAIAAAWITSIGSMASHLEVPETRTALPAWKWMSTFPAKEVPPAGTTMNVSSAIPAFIAAAMMVKAREKVAPKATSKIGSK
mmetsp:Transcript_25225/g.72983  ORF Transcript_25225/g.72983 Transcript_25225/m.72983 type:complete len:201 (+) Transcript_25225:1282-1884(+)